ncbi:MAG TPA: DUF5714 domain-containing protein [Anaeromyxobacteraceae bacterium]|nr:DUF5714 domain-containing protein [Anaeromyxobacteraceae bacterium]
MPCLACTQPCTSAFCNPCAALEYPQLIRAYCHHSTSTNPVEMAQALMTHPRFPAAGQAHHPLVSGVLVAAYRNAGGDAGAAEIDTAIQRANTIPGGFCAGFGADAAAIACGIAVSVIEGATVKAEHAVARSLAHTLTGQGLLLIANNHGNRCCKRSVFTVLELAAHFFTATMGVPLAPPRGRVECAFSGQNKLCNEADCKFYPAVPHVKAKPPLAVLG